MADSAKTSTRFRRAATTERARLIRQREKISIRAEGLRDELGELERQIQEICERIDSLQGLIGDRESQPLERVTPALGDKRHIPLTGGKIRMTAVRVLIESGRGEAPIHYKSWFELLCGAGYGVAGKRPDAVFLSQVTRSPAVKATTRAGVYELDWGAPERLRLSLEALQDKLSSLAAGTSSGRDELEERTARQEALSLEIRRTRRALTEATESLGEALARPPAKLAA